MEMKVIQTIRRCVSQAWRIKTAKPEKQPFTGSTPYWLSRYENGGHSGPGSRNEMAGFKAKVLNDFVSRNNVRSVVEFGCGDGQQLALYDFPSFIGLDIVPEALRRCARRFSEDTTKSFVLFDPIVCVDNHELFKADLALSIEVIFHLVEDEVFEAYMNALFASGRRYVIIFSSDREGEKTAPHVRHRKFTEWIAAHQPRWQCVNIIPNEFPWDPSSDSGSFSDFFIYEKTVDK